MKKLLIAICLFVGLRGMGQQELVINVPRSASGQDQALLNLPTDYSTTSKKYAIFVFLHGRGESCPPLSNIYNNKGSGGPTWWIEHSGWPSSFTNPNTGVAEQYIVLSPQSACNGWSVDGNQLDSILCYMIRTYRVDSNRIILSGVSAGGDGIYRYVGHIANDGGIPCNPRYKAAAIIPMSEAGGAPAQSAINIINADNIPGWGFGDPNNDIHGYNTQLLINGLTNKRFTTFNAGHGPWDPYYNPAYHEVIGGKSMNIYEWGLTQTRQASTAPGANAGNPQTITLPTSTVSLSGSGTAGAGSITAYLWTHLSGPAGSSITTPTTAGTGITGLTQGTHVFRLTVTQTDAQQATSDVTITVNAASGPVANAGSNQSITLPTNSVTLSGSSSTGTITSYTWSKISGPATFAITTPTTVGTTVTGLIAGTYVFQLSLNAGVSTASVTVNVSPQSPNGCPSHNKYLMADDGGNGTVIAFAGSILGTSGGNPKLYTGGDTIVYVSGRNYGDQWIDGIHGTSHACPITIINQGGQAHITSTRLINSTHIHWTGTGDIPTFYGFLMKYGDSCANVGRAGMSFEGRSQDVEFDHIYSRDIGQAGFFHSGENCADSLNYPYVMDSLIVHDTKNVHTGHEGFYIGDTSPDNSDTSYDQRPVICPPSTTVSYPIPPRIGYVHIYNNIFDSTGRGAIQLASQAMGALSEIDHNTIRHAGMSGVTNQGTGISVGAYAHPYIHDNIIINTLTWGIAILGGSGTGIPIRIENNTIDSTGFLFTWNGVNDTYCGVRSEPFYAPGQIPGNIESLNFSSPIYVGSRPTYNPIDSTIFVIKNNSLGKIYAGSGPNKIKLEDGRNTFAIRGSNICGNTSTDGLSVTYQRDIPAGVIIISDCTVPQVTSGKIPVHRKRRWTFKL